MSDHIKRFRWFFWTASLIHTGEFIGFTGLEGVYFKAPFTNTPAVEIGWRFAFDIGGKDMRRKARWQFFSMDLIRSILMKLSLLQLCKTSAQVTSWKR